ncbi:MAG: hypothetical protein ACRDK3_16960 [Actinomycetota bacterium]
MLREAADELSLGLALHAGETGGPDRIWAALNDLGADRIGHGVASVRDEALVKRLARDGIPVEVCPSSNVSLGIFETLGAHPFPELWGAGLNVTVNSDDLRSSRPLSRTICAKRLGSLSFHQTTLSSCSAEPRGRPSREGMSANDLRKEWLVSPASRAGRPPTPDR